MQQVLVNLDSGTIDGHLDKARERPFRILSSMRHSIHETLKGREKADGVDVRLSFSIVFLCCKVSKRAEVWICTCPSSLIEADEVGKGNS